MNTTNPSASEVTIYVASRASVPARPQMWKRLRAQGWPISSTWIDEAGEGETGDFQELWQRIHDEIAASCGVILYAEESDFPLKGAYIECGMALGMGKPVAIVLKFPLTDRSMRPLGSWANHPLVKLCQSLDQARNYVQSARAAIARQAAPEAPASEQQAGGEVIAWIRDNPEMIHNNGKELSLYKLGKNEGWRALAYWKPDTAPASEQQAVCVPTCFYGDCPPCVKAGVASSAASAASASGECRNCDGSGRDVVWTSAIGSPTVGVECSDCDGTGRAAAPSRDAALLPDKALMGRAVSVVHRLCNETPNTTDAVEAGDVIQSFMNHVAAAKVAQHAAQAPHAGAALDAETQAARDVLAERSRQVEAEGWTPEHDDEHDSGELSLAAACYAVAGDSPHGRSPNDWPWDESWWKPSDDRRNLIKAAALILADIERIDRAAMSAAKQGEQG